MASSVLAPATVDYPSSDGTPVAESDFQLTPLAYAREALRDHYRDRGDVYVAANLFIYYEEDDGDAAVAPDVFVVLGAPGHERQSYRLWEEPKGPDFVLEVTSRRTWREDQGRKRRLYESLGVREYWQYDPTGVHLQPRLQGLRLVGGRYRRIAERGSAEGRLELYSRVLGLELRVTERGFRFHDPESGGDLLSLTEHSEARQRAEQERQRERQARQRAERGWQQAEHARQQAEARVAELEARLRDRGNSER